MKKSFLRNCVTAVAGIALVTTPALARKASTLTDINGNSGASAENMLEQRGFKHVTTHKNSQGYAYSYWWHGGDKNCVVAEVYNGVVETMNDAKDSDCNHSGGGNTAAAVGVVAGAALLGALLTHKSHHKEGKDYDESQTAEFERGYKDGLYNAAYHNYSRSDAYSHGYTQGVDERNANLSHHHGRGGYTSAVAINDLRGARAAGAMDEMDRRGFTQVDNFTSGNTRYSIQWRSTSRQCVQMTIADGHIYDIRDIGKHPGCRS